MRVLDPRTAARIRAERVSLFGGLFDHCPPRAPRDARVLNPDVADDADATTRRFAHIEID